MKIKSYKSFFRSSFRFTKSDRYDSKEGHVVTNIGPVLVRVYRSLGGRESRSFDVYYKGRKWTHWSNEGVTFSPQHISRQAREFAKQVLDEAKR